MNPTYILYPFTKKFCRLIDLTLHKLPKCLIPKSCSIIRFDFSSLVLSIVLLDKKTEENTHITILVYTKIMPCCQKSLYICSHLLILDHAPITTNHNFLSGLKTLKSNTQNDITYQINSSERIFEADIRNSGITDNVPSGQMLLLKNHDDIILYI